MSTRKILLNDLSTRGRGIARVIIRQAKSNGLTFDRGAFGVSRRSTLDGRVVFDKNSSQGGPVCAVGAAILYKDVNVVPDVNKGNGPAYEEETAATWDTNEISAFALHYSVPLTFAIGVSDGFENEPEPRIFVASEYVTRLGKVGDCHNAVLGSRTDYREGRRVGRYIAQRAGLDD